MSRKTSSATVQPTLDQLLQEEEAKERLHDVMEATKEHSVLLRKAPRRTSCLCCEKPVVEGIRLPEVHWRSSEQEDKGGWVHEACFMLFEHPGTPFPQPHKERVMTDGFLWKERIFTDPLSFDKVGDVMLHAEMKHLKFHLFHNPNGASGSRMYCRSEISQKSLNRAEKTVDKFLVPTKGLTTCYPELPKWQATWPNEKVLRRACPELWDSLDAFGISRLKFGTFGGRDGFQITMLDLWSSQSFHIANMVVKEVAKSWMQIQLGIEPRQFWTPQDAVEHFLGQRNR